MSDKTPRELGCELLDATARYDIAVALDFDNYQSILVTSTIVRCRRLLRGVHALADADLRLEAVVLVRTMTEYAIKLTWMLTGDTEYHMAQWAIADIDGRLKIHNEVLRVSGVEVLPTTTQADLAAQRAGFVATCGNRTVAQPDLAAQAHAAESTGGHVGMNHLYAMPYRADSQHAAHATVWALEMLMEERDGRLVVYPEVAPGRRQVDAYASGAYALGVVLAAGLQALGHQQLYDRVVAIHNQLPGLVPPERLS